jgi:soluble lytic murein transglycosylase-like protein
MKRLNPLLIPGASASGFYQMVKKRLLVQTLLETAELGIVAAVALFFLLLYFSANTQTGSISNTIFAKLALVPHENESALSDSHKVTNLADKIEKITNSTLSSNRAFRYAALIYHAAQECKVNPLEIIAVIMAESSFKAESVNRKTGDYGLGQVNWEHWGKPFGLTRQELLDPSINIYLTCHVYKYFGEDFGKYNRGKGIRNEAYVVNVKSILSTLNAIEELEKKKII